MSVSGRKSKLGVRGMLLKSQIVLLGSATSLHNLAVFSRNKKYI